MFNSTQIDTLLFTFIVFNFDDPSHSDDGGFFGAMDFLLLPISIGPTTLSARLGEPLPSVCICLCASVRVHPSVCIVDPSPRWCCAKLAPPAPRPQQTRTQLRHDCSLDLNNEATHCTHCSLLLACAHRSKR